MKQKILFILMALTVISFAPFAAFAQKAPDVTQWRIGDDVSENVGFGNLNFINDPMDFWKVDCTKGSPNTMGGLFELYDGSVDVYQYLYLPAGMYELNCQGYYRFGNSWDVDPNSYANGTWENLSKLYAVAGIYDINSKVFTEIGNTFSNPLMPRLFEEVYEQLYVGPQDGEEGYPGWDMSDGKYNQCGGRWGPCSIPGSLVWFASGKYLPFESDENETVFNKVTFCITEDCWVKVGVSKKQTKSADDFIVTNFHLIYQGTAINTDEIISLQDVPFCTWDGSGVDAKPTGSAECEWVVGKPIIISYGLKSGYIDYLTYADLSPFSKLIVTTTSGMPRCIFNCVVYEGAIQVEVPRDNSYWTASDNGDGSISYIVDLRRIYDEYGFVHLHAIKGASWQDVVITKMMLVKEDDNKFYADIETTEMILNEDKCQDRFVSITLTNQANLGSDTFTGSLSLALANDDNEIILAFGTPFSLSNLGHYQIRGNAITLEGELPDTLQDGHYRLCTAAQQKDFTNWTAITRFTLENGYLGETSLPYFYDLWIIDGCPTLYPESTPKDLDEQEWLSLQLLANNLISQGWKDTWNLSNGKDNVSNLPGVTILNGHVISINLSDSSINGSFPIDVLRFPYLQKLDLSQNSLTGDISLLLAQYINNDSFYTNSIQELNLSNNNLSGNIGLFARYFTQLKTLDASRNCFEDVYPMIPSTVTTLDISQQTISRIVPLHLSSLSAADIATKVPSILLYDHQNQTFTPNINLLCSTADNSWGMMLAYQNGILSLPYVSEQNTYYGESGDTLNVSVIKNNGTREGSTFRISLSFDEGDGNFDGKVNVLDVQTEVLYVFNQYKNRPFNYTAANLWTDEQINVQDIVALVNLLFETEPSLPIDVSRRSQSVNESQAEAFVYSRDGQLIINSSQTMAAFDIILADCSNIAIADALKQLGFVCESRRVDGGLRLIGYSLLGATLPIGETVIGTTPDAGTVIYCMLADSDAIVIASTPKHNDITGVKDMQKDAQTSGEIYRIRFDGNHVISIDRQGKKTLVNEK